MPNKDKQEIQEIELRKVIRTPQIIFIVLTFQDNTDLIKENMVMVSEGKCQHQVITGVLGSRKGVVG